MTTPSSTDAALRASVTSYTNFRIALASAALGGIGASLGWLACLAYEARNEEMLKSATVGVVIGLVIHWLQHYVRTAIRERRGETPLPRSPHHSLFALLWATGSGLIALASEHLLVEMVSVFLRPLLASVASLIPAGALIGWSMSRGRATNQNLLQLVGDGLLIGLSIAIVTGVIWTLALDSAPWGALCAWWGLIGLATRLMTGTARNAVKIADPILAVAMVFAGTFLVNLLPLTQTTYEILGPFRTMPIVIRAMAAEVQASPGFPAKSWLDAEIRLAEEQPKPAAAQPQAPKSTPSRSDKTGLTISADAMKKAVADETSPPDRSVQGELTLMREHKAELIRSWFIIVLFAIGLGLAPTVERALRPIDYPNSETFKQDLWIAGVVGGLPILTCLVTLLFGRPK